MHEYKCVKKTCQQYGRVVSKPFAPQEYRQATGSFVRCGKCFGLMQWVSRGVAVAPEPN